MKKLEKYEIRGKDIEWIKIFLSRKQRVIVYAKISSFIPVTSGKPQNGKLSDILFSLYINIFPGAMEFSSILLYADDANIFLPIVDQLRVGNL